MNYLKKWKKTGLLVLLPVISYFVLGPLEIYYGNQSEFDFSCGEAFFPMLLAGLILWMAGSCLLALLPPRAGKIASVIVFAFGIASYLQYLFLNVKLSELDGGPLQWETLGNFPLIDAIAWVAVFVAAACLCWFSKQNWTMISSAVAGILCVMQLATLVPLAVVGFNSPTDTLHMSGEKQFKVAAEDNIVVFVLDTLGNRQFDQLLASRPETEAALCDFTYYNNADCHYYRTFPSMTHALTGIEFDFTAESSQKWMADAWNSERAENFYAALHQAGYLCELYSPAIGYQYGTTDNLAGKFDNICEMQHKVDRITLLKKILKLSIYRYAPYIIKPYFEVLTYEFQGLVKYNGMDSRRTDNTISTTVDDNVDFYQLLSQKKLSIDGEMQKALIVQHLYGMHTPYTLGADGTYVGDAGTKESCLFGLSLILETYLDQMKELGVYENATIIITADHGDEGLQDYQPVFLMKQTGENHAAMQTNAAPISLDDLQATVLAAAGQEGSEYGVAAQQQSETEARPRTVYIRQTDPTYPDVKGSAYNVYYGYTYSTDRTELEKKVAAGPEDVLPATPW